MNARARGWRGDGAPHLARSARQRRDTRTEWGCHSDRTRPRIGSRPQRNSLLDSIIFYLLVIKFLNAT